MKELESSPSKRQAPEEQEYTFNNNLNEEYENFGNIRIHAVHSASSAGDDDKKDEDIVIPPHLQK